MLRLAYAIASGALAHPQTWEQEELATNLVEHHAYVFTSGDFTYRSYTEPMYPFLAAAVYLATNHNQTALVLLQLVIAAATIRVVGTLPHGEIAALLLAIHPGFIRYSSVLHPFVLDSFFFVAAAAALLRFRHEPTLRRGIAAALLIGLGALTRPTILLYLVPLCWIARRVPRMLLLGFIALAVVAPWTIRNAVVHHTFMLTRSGSGLVFWLGNNPHSTGSATDTAGEPVIRNAPPEIANAKNEVERDRIFREAAWQYIRAHPFAAIGRFAQRVYYFWWFSPQWGAAYSPMLKLAYRAWWLVLLALMAIGATKNRSRDVWFLAALAMLISLLQSAYYVEGRHRLAIEPLLLPLAALGINRLRGREHHPNESDRSTPEPRTVPHFEARSWATRCEARGSLPPIPHAPHTPFRTG